MRPVPLPASCTGDTAQVDVGARSSLQTPWGGSSRVAVAALVLQRQLLDAAPGLQLLARCVQLRFRLLAPHLLQHQVLQGQGDNKRGTRVQQKWQEGRAQAFPRMSNALPTSGPAQVS